MCGGLPEHGSYRFANNMLSGLTVKVRQRIECLNQYVICDELVRENWLLLEGTRILVQKVPERTSSGKLKNQTWGWALTKLHEWNDMLL
jgi:hypothetical protein